MVERTGQVADDDRGAVTTEQGRHVGDGADVRLFVGLLAGNDGFLAGRFGREDDAESGSNTLFVEPFAQHVGQRAVV